MSETKSCWCVGFQGLARALLQHQQLGCLSVDCLDFFVFWFSMVFIILGLEAKLLTGAQEICTHTHICYNMIHYDTT